jgi:DNA-binding CsgD family transcriptional regulator
MEMAERIGHPLFAELPATLLAYIDLWTGEPSAAHDRMNRFRESFLSSGFGFIGSLTLDLWTVDIEALIACGRLDEAQSVVDDLIQRANDVHNPNAIAIAERFRGLLLGAHGEVEPAIAAMETALVEHARRPLRRQIARTLLELGSLKRRAKQKTAAKQSLDRALAMFVAIGAPMWEDRARDELGRIGLRRPAVTDGLTPAQQRVAELVASGMSNREVASTLYMSVRSVESHLTKVYRELGVKSRSQLAAALAATRSVAEEADHGRVNGLRDAE